MRRSRGYRRISVKAKESLMACSALNSATLRIIITALHARCAASNNNSSISKHIMRLRTRLYQQSAPQSLAICTGGRAISSAATLHNAAGSAATSHRHGVGESVAKAAATTSGTRQKRNNNGVSRYTIHLYLRARARATRRRKTVARKYESAPMAWRQK